MTELLARKTHTNVLQVRDGMRMEYLTVTGTSAEAADDGEVGRGNRATGLITPYRPMSIEAVAGKNPVSHVGKLYNLLAARIAAEAVAGAPGVEEACCVLVSRIGRPFREPDMADVRVRLAPHAELPRARLEHITRAQLARADDGDPWPSVQVAMTRGRQSAI